MVDKPQFLWIHVAENDDHGNPTGRVGMFMVIDPLDYEVCLRLEPSVAEEDGLLPFYSNHRLIGFAGKFAKYTQKWDNSGNMAISGYLLPAWYALGFLNHLMTSGQWQCTEAYVDLADKWEKQIPFSADDFGLISCEPLILEGLNHAN